LAVISATFMGGHNARRGVRHAGGIGMGAHLLVWKPIE